MKIKPSTLFLVLAALVLAGVVAIVQTQVPPLPKTSETPETAQEKPLFSFKESQVQAFTLTTQLRSLKFQRNKDGKWQMLEPDNTPASEASIAFLLNLISTGKSQRSFTAPRSSQEEYSFHQPLATIDLTLDNKETHKLILGGYDFNHTNIYAQTDPSTSPTDPLTVLIVSANFENAVSRPLSDWKKAADQPGAENSKSPSAAKTAAPEALPSASPSESASP